MKRYGKIALGALMLAGTTTIASVPAQAQVSVGIGGGYYDGGYGAYGATCDPRSRWYSPYRCGGEYAGYYDEPYYGGD